AQCGGGLLGVR
nr:glial hyaluronate-binding protein, GHAP=polypeptide L36-NT67 [cattle, spinal cord, Peptide Partial, 11 aa] [Bos taurus]